MRCSGWSSRAISACNAALALGLVFAATTSAHVTASPPFIATGGSATLSLATPNERDVAMTGFSVTVPDGVEIERAHAATSWEAMITGATASWSGGSLAPGGETAFVIEVATESDPGTAELDAVQLYPKGGVVRWPVAITVLPAEDSPSQNLLLAGVVGLLGLLGVAAVAAVAWRRRVQSLQEK